MTPVRILFTKRSLLFLSLLVFSFGLVACDGRGGIGSGGNSGDDDDSVLPGDDDDASGDDDDASGGDDDDSVPSGPPAMTLTPSDITAGQYIDVSVGLENFTVTEGTEICCQGTDEDVRYLGTQSNSDAGFVGSFFFGVLMDGAYPWGLQNGTTEVSAEFNASAVTMTDLAPGTAIASGTIAGDRGYEVYKVEVANANSVVAVQATNIGNEAFHPYVWFLADDGYTGVATGGFPDDNDVYGDPVATFYTAEAGTYYLRVDDYEFAGGSDYTFDLDLSISDAGAATAVADAEPNDTTNDWQDLGTLSSGLYNLTGTSATQGHDATSNDPNGDLDVFVFEVAEDANVNFTLSWDTDSGNDFDAVVYDNSGATTTLGFGSEQALGTSMASTSNPETATYAMEASKSYAVMIANWEGTDGASWTMDIVVLADPFAAAGSR